MSTDGPGLPRHHSRTVLIKAVVVGLFFVVIIVSGWLYMRPSRGLREVQRSRDAVHQATSWHLMRSGRLPDGSWQYTGNRDVVCPADFDETTIRPDHNNDTEHRVELHGFFYRQLPSGAWQRSGNGPIALPECGLGPYLDPFTNIYSDLEDIERNGEVQRGSFQDTDGVNCQWWHIMVVRSPNPKYSVCLDEKSHLPLLVTSIPYGFNYSFSKWNETTIATPGPIAEPPKPQSPYYQDYE